jgi:4-hydroxymandelate synthase
MEVSSMPALDVEYLEFYASDEPLAVEYFVSSFGFTRVAESGHRGNHSSLLRQGEVQIVVTAGQAAEEFLDAHGDGIADIAFRCDDVAETRRRALAAGASLIASAADRQVVSGFCGTRHTLLTRPGKGSLPIGWTWVPVRDVPASPGGRIKLLDHVALCAEAGTLTDSADFYSNAFGLTRYSSEYIQIGDQAMDSLVVRSPSASITFTILEQDLTKKAGQVEAFISRNGGAGVQHLAFLVDDIIPAVHDFSRRGLDFLSIPGAYYEMLGERLPGMRGEIADLRAANVLADRDEWGYLLQLFTRSPYKRNTLFYELVQRRGARGFGGSNIRALYEAVERDGLAGE